MHCSLHGSVRQPKGLRPRPLPARQRGHSCPSVQVHKRARYSRKQGLVVTAGQSLYEVLGVATSATDREIKKAFKQKALKLHPDVNKAANAAEQFQECKMAYQTLIDNASREKYNRELRNGKQSGFDWDNLWGRGQPEQKSAAQRPSKQQEEPFYGFSDFFRDISADWEQARRKRAAKGTPTGSIWQELAGLGEDFVEFLEVELARSSDPELRRQAQASAQSSTAGSSSSGSSDSSSASSTSSANSSSSSNQGKPSGSSGWSDPTAAQVRERAAQIERENEERKKKTNDEVEDMLADMKRKLGLED